MTGYCRDAYHPRPALEDDPGWETIDGLRDDEWEVPTHFITALIGGLSAIGLAAGVVLKWLL